MLEREDEHGGCQGGKASNNDLLSGKRTLKAIENGPCIVDLPVKNNDFP